MTHEEHHHAHGHDDGHHHGHIGHMPPHHHSLKNGFGLDFGLVIYNQP